MRKLFLFFVIWMICGPVSAQKSEFGETYDGLIYSKVAMGKLKHIVDSLHIKFKTCDLTRVYHSKPHTKAHFIRLSDLDGQQVKKDVDAGISLDLFLKKYPTAKIDSNLLVIKEKFRTYLNEERIQFEDVFFTGYFGASLQFDKNIDYYDGALMGKWIYEFNENEKTGKRSLKAFYFPNEFVLQPIPVKYAKLILYTDCMVDTSTNVFFENAVREDLVPDFLKTEKAKESELTKFMDYSALKTGRPIFKEKYSQEQDSLFWEKLHQFQKLDSVWAPTRLARMDKLNKKDPEFRRLLKNALNAQLKKNESGNEFEEYVGRYISKSLELELKRGREVVGMCSRDDGPRYHAFDIALLAAETTKWDVFLRSHLDIMNDNFDRAAENDAARARRETYIKELELLDIDVLSLLLGSALRIDDPSSNHYFGDIQRLGKSIAETKYPEIFERKISEIIADSTLDDYNRMLMYFLWINYINNLGDKESWSRNQSLLAKTAKTLPDYLYQKIKLAEQKHRP